MRLGDCFAAEGTAAIWGAFKRKPRNGAGSHVIPVNTGFHITSITDPGFKLGTQPFEPCFPLKVHDIEWLYKLASPAVSVRASACCAELFLQQGFSLLQGVATVNVDCNLQGNALGLKVLPMLPRHERSVSLCGLAAKDVHCFSQGGKAGKLERLVGRERRAQRR